MIWIIGWPEKWQAKLDRALLDSACRGRRERVEWLLALGANPDVAGWCNLGLVSALSAACIHEDETMVRQLLRNGASPYGNPIEPMTPYDRVTDEYASEAARCCAIALASRFA
jgi:ankyrin repeat protein